MRISKALGNVGSLDLTPLPKEEAHHSDSGFVRIETKAGAAIDAWEAKKGVIGGSPPLDEIFIVITGSATVTFDETGETFDIGPGDMVRLGAGEPNRWVVHEDLRKISFFEPR